MITCIDQDGMSEELRDCASELRELALEASLAPLAASLVGLGSRIAECAQTIEDATPCDAPCRLKFDPRVHEPSTFSPDPNFDNCSFENGL